MQMQGKEREERGMGQYVTTARFICTQRKEQATYTHAYIYMNYIYAI